MSNQEKIIGTDYKPKNMPDIVPYLVVRDAKTSLDFYKNAFDFEVLDSVTDNVGTIQHVEMKRGPIVMMFCQEGDMKTTAKSPASRSIEGAISLYCYCSNVDQFYASAIANGATSPMPPEDCFCEIGCVSLWISIIINGSSLDIWKTNNRVIFMRSDLKYYCACVILR